MTMEGYTLRKGGFKTKEGVFCLDPTPIIHFIFMANIFEFEFEL